MTDRRQANQEPTAGRPCFDCKGTGRAQVEFKRQGKTVRTEGPCPTCGGSGRAGYRTK